MTDFVLIPFRTACDLVARCIGGPFSVADCFTRARERATLRNLSDAALKDCGLTRADVAREIRRLRW